MFSLFLEVYSFYATIELMQARGYGVSVIIPFFNEEKTLSRVIKKILKRPDVKQIILVDDGSTDKSGFSILNFQSLKKVLLIKHPERIGKGAAIIRGLRECDQTFVVIQDADLEYNSDEIPKLLKPLILGQAEFVFGNRWQSKRGYLLAQIGNYILTQLINLLFGVNFQDPYTGYKAGSAKVWKSLKLKSKGFEIEAEIAVKLALKKIKVLEVPISYNPRTYAEGKKIGFLDVFKGVFSLLRLKFGKL